MTVRGFFGGNPVAVVLKLLAISLLVGMILSFFGVTPQNFFYVIDDVFRTIYDVLFGTFDWIVQYIAVGALLVVPIWFVVRLLRSSSSPPRDG